MTARRTRKAYRVVRLARPPVGAATRIGFAVTRAGLVRTPPVALAAGRVLVASTAAEVRRALMRRESRRRAERRRRIVRRSLIGGAVVGAATAALTRRSSESDS
jgi:hypothetical protein